MKRKFILLTLILIFSFMPILARENSSSAEETNKSGWVTEQGKNYYYQNNKPVEGWKKLAGTWYYFDRGGSMATGWRKVNGNWYFLKGSGAMAKGWLKNNGYWYYLYPGGSMATGWLKNNGYWYYLYSGGSMATGWIKSGGNWYLLNPGGSMATGWEKKNGKWWYLTKAKENVKPEGAWSSGVTDAYYAAGRYNYRYGGASPSTGFDCSGFVKYYLGLDARSSVQQSHLGKHHYDVWNAPAGAIMCYGSEYAPSHVGISMGDGTVAHAMDYGIGIKVTSYKLRGLTASYYVIPGKY